MKAEGQIPNSNIPHSKMELNRTTAVGASLITTLNGMVEENLISAEVAMHIIKIFDEVYIEELQKDRRVDVDSAEITVNT